MFMIGFFIILFHFHLNIEDVSQTYSIMIPLFNLPYSIFYPFNCKFTNILFVIIYLVCVCVCVCVTQSCSTLQPHGLQTARLLCPWNSPGNKTGVGCHFLLQGIFSTHRANLGFLHCRQILYCLSSKGSLYTQYQSQIPSKYYFQ